MGGGEQRIYYRLNNYFQFKFAAMQNEYIVIGLTLIKSKQTWGRELFPCYLNSFKAIS